MNHDFLLKNSKYFPENLPKFSANLRQLSDLNEYKNFMDTFVEDHEVVPEKNIIKQIVYFCNQEELDIQGYYVPKDIQGYYMSMDDRITMISKLIKDGKTVYMVFINPMNFQEIVRLIRDGIVLNFLEIIPSDVYDKRKTLQKQEYKSWILFLKVFKTLKQITAENINAVPSGIMEMRAILQAKYEMKFKDRIYEDMEKEIDSNLENLFSLSLTEGKEIDSNLENFFSFLENLFSLSPTERMKRMKRHYILILLLMQFSTSDHTNKNPQKGVVSIYDMRISLESKYKVKFEEKVYDSLEKHVSMFFKKMLSFEDFC